MDLEEARALKAQLKDRSKHAQACFESLTSVAPSSLEDIAAVKLASIEDAELFAVARTLPGDALEQYEALGGKYKVAFGTPMFQTATKVPAAPAAAAPRVTAGAVSSAVQTPSVPSMPSVPEVGTGSVGQ